MEYFALHNAELCLYFLKNIQIHLMIDHAESCKGKANICVDEYDLKRLWSWSSEDVFNKDEYLQSRRIYSP